MMDFLHTVTLQMRKITAIQIINHFLSMFLILATTGTAIFLWSNNEIAIGVVAAACAFLAAAIISLSVELGLL